MEPNQTNAAAELQAKLMPLFHAIQSEIASQVMKDPSFVFGFKTAIGNCRVEVNYPHLSGAAASRAKPVPTDHADAMDAAARSAAMPKVSDADRAVIQSAFDTKAKKIPAI